MELTDPQRRALRRHQPPVGWPEGPLRTSEVPYNVLAAMEKKGLCFFAMGTSGRWCSTLTPAGVDARLALIDTES